MRLACVFGAVLDGLRTHGAAGPELRVHAAVGAGGAVSLAALEEASTPKADRCYSCMTATCTEATSKTLVQTSDCHSSKDTCGSKKCGGNWCAVEPNECQTDLQEIAVLKSDEHYREGRLENEERRADMEARLASNKNTVIAAASAVKQRVSQMEAEDIAEDAKKQAAKMKAQTHDLHMQVEELTAKLEEHTASLEALKDEHEANRESVEHLEGVVQRATAAKERMEAKRAMAAKERMDKLTDLAEEKYSHDLEEKIAIATEHDLAVGGRDAADLKHCKPDLSQESEKVQELYRSLAAQEENTLPERAWVVEEPLSAEATPEAAPADSQQTRTGCMTEIDVALKEEGAHQEDERLQRFQMQAELAIKAQEEHERQLAAAVKREALREVQEEQQADASAAEQALRHADAVENGAEQAVDPAVKRPKLAATAPECADEDAGCWSATLADARDQLKAAKEQSAALGEQIEDATKHNLELQAKLKKAQEALKNASVVIPDNAAPKPKDKAKEAAEQEKAAAEKDAAELDKIKKAVAPKKKDEAEAAPPAS